MSLANTDRMRLATKLPIILLASMAVLPGCKKSDNKPAEKTAAPAPAPAATPPAAPAAAPAPAPPPAPPAPTVLTVKDDDYKQVAGVYDGTKAVALADPTHFEVVVPFNCGPAFGCGITTQWANSIDGEKFAKACPKGVALHLDFEDINGPDDPKPGKHTVSAYVVEGSGSQTSLDKGDILDLKERTADSVSGTLTWSEGPYGINGPFKATMCKPQK